MVLPQTSFQHLLSTLLYPSVHLDQSTFQIPLRTSEVTNTTNPSQEGSNAPLGKEKQLIFAQNILCL